MGVEFLLVLRDQVSAAACDDAVVNVDGENDYFTAFME